jgi:hypothetical protein
MATNNAINNSADNLVVENLDFTASTISTVSTNSNLILAPNGTGKVSIGSVYTLPSADGTSGQAIVTNGSGVTSFQTITTTPFTWNNNTAVTTVAMAVNNGYFANNSGSQIVYTLPSTFATGDVIEVVAITSNGFRINQNTSQFIIVGDDITTIGTGGFLSSTLIGDWVRLVAVSPSTLFVASVEQGNITIN